MKDRKVIQISTEIFNNTAYSQVLCDDGTMWTAECGVWKWQKIPDVPQPVDTGNCATCDRFTGRCCTLGNDIRRGSCRFHSKSEGGGDAE